MPQKLPALINGDIYLKDSEGENIMLVVNKKEVKFKHGLKRRFVKSLRKAFF